MASTPPTSRKSSPAQRNCFAMTLWSIEKTYFRQKDVGGG